MKRYICLALLTAVIGVSLASCAAVYNALGISGKGKELGTPDEDQMIPIPEGYYLTDEHALQLVYTGNDVECSYDVYICDAMSGEEEFLGMAYGLNRDTEKLTVPGYSDVRITLGLSYETDDTDEGEIVVTDESANGYGEAYEGKYAYFGTEWHALSADNTVYMTAGKYRNGSYCLIITIEDGSIGFVVKDADDVMLFEAGRKLSGDVSEVAFERGSSTIRFLKGVDSNGAFVDLVEVGGKSASAYAGRFYIVK